MDVGRPSSSVPLVESLNPGKGAVDVIPDATVPAGEDVAGSPRHVSVSVFKTSDPTASGKDAEDQGSRPLAVVSSDVRVAIPGQSASEIVPSQPASSGP